MNHHNPPPPILCPTTTTTQILKQTTSLFYSHILTFLFLSIFVLVFRINVHTASLYLYPLIDRDPSLKSVPSRIDLPDAGPLNHRRHSRRGAYLHLSRVGTLDDDFFSGTSNLDRSLFNPSPRKPLPNATLLILSDFNPNYGFSDSIADHGISFPGIVKPGIIGFNPSFHKNATFSDEEEEEIKFVQGGLEEQNDGNAVLDLDFLNKGFELGNQNATKLFFLAGILSVAYAYVVFEFIVTYTWASGVVFLKAVDHFLGNYRSFFQTLCDGSNIGTRRLSGFILIKWAISDALAQLMGIYFFGEIEDQYILFNVFLRMKFIMPFANLSPWVKGHEWESSGFVVIWFLIDLLLGLVFAIDSWVVIVDSRRGGREIVKKGYRLLVALFWPAFKIRWLEVIICGSLGRWMLKRVFGEALTMIFQSLMEVYFMVAWLVFYFAARQKDDANLGTTFGRRDLEGLLDVAR